MPAAAAALAGAAPFAPLAGAAAAGAFGSAATSGSLLGAATVAITKSRPAITGFTSPVPWRSDQRTLSLMSSAARSAWNASGTLSGSAITSTLRRTTFSTPPRFRPGEVASFWNCTATDTRMRSPAARRWKSTWIGLSDTGWNCTSRIRARENSPATLTSYRRDRHPPRCSSRTTRRGSSCTRVGVCLAP